MKNFLKATIITSKSIRCIVERNQFLFNVDHRLKKPEIKKLFQEILNNQIISINTYNLPPRKRHIKMKRVFVKFVATEGKVRVNSI